MTYLCTPLAGTTGDEMARQIDAAQAAGADMVELRLDFLGTWNQDILRELMLKARQFGGPVIATCRIREEGGQYTGDEVQRIGLLELAGLIGADYLDVEYDAWSREPELRERISMVCEISTGHPNPRRRLILSRHDFQKTPQNLDTILTGLSREPCHVIKLACNAETITDSLRMLDALRESAANRSTIALSMGETGLLTRVLARKLGAFLTFASLEAGRESAPGQPTIQEMRELYRWDAIGAETGVYGVIGCPVAHSMSPAIHNAGFAAVGHDGVYLPMRVEPDYASFAAFLDGCLARPWLDVRGFSVTIPHKENLLRYVRERGGAIEPLAERIGVANTLMIKEGERGRLREGETRTSQGPAQAASPPLSLSPSPPLLYACNTDYRGALDALCEGLGCTRSELAERPVAVLGAGGAARAIVAGLRDCGCRVTLYNRTNARARRLAGEFGCIAAPWEHRDQLRTDVVINCTSLGMWPDVDDTPLPASALASRPVVFDTIYNPMETRLLREARERGCRTIDGVDMFVNQAAAQFKLWTGQPAPRHLMRDAVKRCLRG